MTQRSFAEQLRSALSPFIQIETMRGAPMIVRGRRFIPTTRAVRIARLGRGGAFGFIWNRPTVLIEELDAGIYRNHHIHDVTLRTILTILAVGAALRLLLPLFIRPRSR